MKLKSKIIAGVFGAVALAAVPVSIALSTTSCGSSGEGSSNSSSDGSGSGPGVEENNNPSQPNKPSTGVGSGGADIIGLTKPIPGVIVNDAWTLGMQFTKNGFTYQIIENPNYFVPEYGYMLVQPKYALKVVAANPGVVMLDKIADNNATGVVQYDDNGNFGRVALPVTVIGANVLANKTIGEPNSEQEIIIPDSVYEIDSGAFNNIKNPIKKITLGNSLRTIETNAFSNLKYNGRLIFPQITENINASAFSNTPFSGELMIPPATHTIGENAFKGCSGFSSIKFPENLNIIQNGAFQDCKGLTGKLIIPSHTVQIGNYAFAGCTGFPAQSVYVESNCLSSIDKNTQVPSIVWKSVSQRPADETPTANDFTPNLLPQSAPEQLPDGNPIPGVIVNDNWAVGETFEKNGFTYKIINNPSYTVPPYGQMMSTPKFGLKLIKANLGVVKLNQLAEDNETGVVSYLPDKTRGQIALPLVEIASAAFNPTFTNPMGFGPGITIGDGADQELIIPNSVVTIGDTAFANIKNKITTFRLSSSLKTIGQTAFAGLLYNDTLVLPSTLESIGAKAFTTSQITGTLTLPPKMKNVEYQCFYNTNLTGVTLNEGLQQIGQGAFCATMLTGTLVIPDSVILIDSKAFYGNKYAPQTVYINEKCTVNDPQEKNLVFTPKI